MQVKENNELAAMLKNQTSPVGYQLFSYVNTFFCSNTFTWLPDTWVNTFYIEKFQVTRKIFKVHYGKALHNCFISCHRKYNDQHNQCDIRAAHDGKVGCNMGYTTGFLYSDWLYFL